MTNEVDPVDFPIPIVHRKSVSAASCDRLATPIHFGDAGASTFAEPAAHGGGDPGPPPLQGVAGELCACISVAPARTGWERDYTSQASTSTPHSRLMFAADANCVE